eukprot:COSAG05_NODE_15876_length_359_cov_0.596154_1_plen_59_part_10
MDSEEQQELMAEVKMRRPHARVFGAALQSLRGGIAPAQQQQESAPPSILVEAFAVGAVT